MTNCYRCGKKLSAFSFKLKSLFHSDKWVCEDCAIEEDEEWILQERTGKVPLYSRH